jgi:hypothetical protein
MKRVRRRPYPHQRKQNPSESKVAKVTLAQPQPDGGEARQRPMAETRREDGIAASPSAAALENSGERHNLHSRRPRRRRWSIRERAGVGRR